MHDRERARSVNWPEIHENLKGCRNRRVLQAHPDLVDDIDVLELLVEPVAVPRGGRARAATLVSTFGGLGAVLGANLERLAERVGWEVACHLGATHSAFKRVLRERVEKQPSIEEWSLEQRARPGTAAAKARKLASAKISR